MLTRVAAWWPDAVKDGSRTFVKNLYSMNGISKVMKIVDLANESVAFNIERPQLWKTFALSHCNTKSCRPGQGCSIQCHDALNILEWCMKSL